ncbi:hypothetical protein DSCO28_15850 [Desulfosarcina ovata subsp. sediminis]|uniref:Uncharacterized protein n=1 Tax=Desulfosarcina ovata subsp. sediminis TaxID=885957 RepID=A0A5K7ZN53_9BACT|nr:hypothetical protein [Desulfosarcina ovata]BBO81019.1 hypothetical protein DSCO28_15850 [Desulfosarcina ovata subsp. sediminis]
MIVDRPESHFIFVVPWPHVHMDYHYINYRGEPLSNEEYLRYWGKWILLGTRGELDAIAKKLDPFVEEKRIPAIKYDRSEIAEFKLGVCVMCVFCDARDKATVWDVLTAQGVDETAKAWLFERETMAMWQPGGRLLEAWIAGRGFPPAQADKIRSDARTTFERMFADKKAIFKGIDQ